MHLLAIANSAGINLTLDDFEELSFKIPQIIKLDPSSTLTMTDLDNAGGISGALKTIWGHSDELKNTINLAGQTIEQRAKGAWVNNEVIKPFDNPITKNPGLAILHGNLAPLGAVVKISGVDESVFEFEGTARVYEREEDAMKGIETDEVVAGDVVVIRNEGPKGGPGMQEMLYPTSYLKSKRLDKVCALVTDGRFSGGTSGLSIGHVSPEAAAGGEIAIVRTGDPIEIDIPNRSIRLLVDEREIAARKAAVKRYAPAARERRVPTSLRAYALLVSSADKGAVRLIDTPDNA